VVVVRKELLLVCDVGLEEVQIVRREMVLAQTTMLVNFYRSYENNYSYRSFSGGRGLVTGKAVMHFGRLASLPQKKPWEQ